MNLREAKKILPKKEFQAFENVVKLHIQRTPVPRLKQLYKLAKRHRDKYRSFSKKQGQDNPGRGTYEIDTSLQDRRVQLLEEIMDAIEDALSERATP